MTSPCANLKFLLAVATVFSLGVVVSTSATAEEGASRGATIYANQCASCHGNSGEGGDGHPAALVGKRPLVGLVKVIAETMPEGEPEAVAGEDARLVAEYVYDAFYSPIAQARNHPPRVELSRLTVREYENSLADLLADPKTSFVRNDKLGLNVEYFNSGRSIRGNTRVVERIEPNIDADFGEAGPAIDKLDKKEYAIRWQGSILIEETGDYEFILDADGGARLWVNDTRDALIDAWVRSGDQTEHRGSLRLLAGRTYPIKVDFFKSKKDKTGSIQLKWQRPHRAVQIIPARVLSPNRGQTQFVMETKFPPDDSTLGYARGANVSAQWDEATSNAAIETTAYVLTHLPGLAGYRPDADDRATKIQQFCQRFTERAFRRPLTEQERKFFVDRWFDEAASPENAARYSLLLTLKSPRFLYHDAPSDRPDPYTTASRISYGLWDTLPDRTLLDAARKDELKTKEHVTWHVRRMLGDERTKAKVRRFFATWLDLNHHGELTKDEQQFEQFNAVLASDLRDSLDTFVAEVMWSEGSDYRRLLTDEAIFLNDQLAAVYASDLAQGDAPQGDDLVAIAPANQPRAGLLTHPYMLSRLAYHAESSPIHRGVFVARHLLGRVLRPPPEAFTPVPAEDHPELTTRQRVAHQTAGASCQSCHAMINPLGFSLEQYDAIGRYRTKEGDKTIDAAGSYTTLAGEQAQFEGPRGLAEFLVGSEEAHSAFVEQFFHFTVRQPIGAYGLDRSNQLRIRFANNDFNMRELLVEVIATSALHQATQPEGATR